MPEDFYKLLSVTLIIYIVLREFYRLCSRKKSDNRLHKPYPFETKDEVALQIIVRQDLGMGKGKIASQAGHAVTGIMKYLKNNPELENAWMLNGQAKIVLKGSDEEIRDVEIRAGNAKVHIYKVYDAGRTQVKSGAQTVLAVGPAPKSVLKLVTGSLKLL